MEKLHCQLDIQPAIDIKKEDTGINHKNTCKEAIFVHEGQ